MLRHAGRGGRSGNKNALGVHVGRRYLRLAVKKESVGKRRRKNYLETKRNMKRRASSDALGRTQNANFVNEDGLYDVILDSRKPEAKRFRKWITSEVLPTIRKHGIYVNPAAPQISPDFLRQVADALEQANQKVAVLTTQVSELEPKASYYDIVLNCKDLVSTSQIAKDYGYSAKAFNKLLKNLHVQFNQGGVWLLYQNYAKLGWTSTKTHTYFDMYGYEHCRIQTYWTQKGRLGLYDLLKCKGYLPTVEVA